MLHLVLHQIDNHCWKLVVTDGFNVIWNASLDTNKLLVRRGSKDFGNVVAEATFKKSSESEAVGIASQLMFNWAQFGPQSNEPLDPRWLRLQNDWFDSAMKETQR